MIDITAPELSGIVDIIGLLVDAQDICDRQGISLGDLPIFDVNGECLGTIKYAAGWKFLPGA